MKKKVRFGLLHSPHAEWEPLYNTIQCIGEYRPIYANDRNPHIDVLILPSAGINPNLPCFIHGDFYGLPAKLMCPFIERFRVHSLQFYLDHEIGVVGVGDSAVILWDLLKGKAAIDSQKVSMLRGNVNAVTFGDEEQIEGFESTINGVTVAGYMQVNLLFAQQLRNMRRDILNEVARIEEGDEPSWVTV